MCLEKAPLVEDIERSVGWTKPWDVALDLRVKHMRGLQALSRLIKSSWKVSEALPHE